MKPTRNRVYCPSCLRSKMLFESEEKANNFIRFNSAEIMELNGKAPTRSYFCRFCSGWHITSISSEQKGQEMDQLDQDRFEKLANGQAKASSAELKAKSREIRKLYNDGISALSLCRFEQAELCFSNALILNPIHSEQIEHAQQICQRIQELLSSNQELDTIQRELLQFNASASSLSQSDKESFDAYISETIINYGILLNLYSILDKAEDAIENKDFHQAQIQVDQCSELLQNLGTQNRKLRGLVNERMQCIKSVIIKNDEVLIAAKKERRDAKREQKRRAELIRIIYSIEIAEQTLSQDVVLAKNLLSSAEQRVKMLSQSEEKAILTQNLERIKKTYGL